MPIRKSATPSAASSASPTRVLLKTSEVLEATGITHQVLYRYVTMGLVQEPVAMDDGPRLFDGRTIAAIRLIHRLNSTGYTLREIKETYFRSKRLRTAGRRKKPQS